MNCPFTYLVGVSPGSGAPTIVKRSDVPAQKTTQTVPRSPSSDVSNAAPTSNVSAANPESELPKTPTKGMACC